MVVETSRPSVPLWNSSKCESGTDFSAAARTLRCRHVSAELLAARLHVFDFGAVVGRAVERRLVQFVVGNRNSEARAEHLQLVFVQLFLLVRDVLAFARFAQSVALDRLGQDDGRCAGVIDRRAVSGVHFDRIVPAQPHARQLVVGEMLDHLQQPGIGAEQILPEIGSALDKIFLILPVADFAQPPDQQAIAVVLNEVVPIGAPDAL